MLTFTLFSPFVFAQDFVFDKEKGRAVPSFIGQIKLMKGKIFKKNGSDVREVELGERFKQNDIIMTQDKSFARILLVDDTLISIGPKSEMKFDEFDFKDKSDRKMTFSLLKGQLTGDVKNKARPGDIQFKTKYTAMGIRGTYFLMNQRTEKSLDIAEYAVLHGSTQVNDEKGQTFNLGKGDRITLIHDHNSGSNEHETKNLSDEDIKYLSAPEIDEEKEVKPFLPFFNVNHYLSKNSSVTEGRNEDVAPEKREEKKPSWQDNLEKLNQKLRENHRIGSPNP